MRSGRKIEIPRCPCHSDGSWSITLWRLAPICPAMMSIALSAGERKSSRHYYNLRALDISIAACFIFSLVIVWSLYGAGLDNKYAVWFTVGYPSSNQVTRHERALQNANVIFVKKNYLDIGLCTFHIIVLQNYDRFWFPKMRSIY